MRRGTSCLACPGTVPPKRDRTNCPLGCPVSHLVSGASLRRENSLSHLGETYTHCTRPADEQGLRAQETAYFAGCDEGYDGYQGGSSEARGPLGTYARSCAPPRERCVGVRQRGVLAATTASRSGSGASLARLQSVCSGADPNGESGGHRTGNPMGFGPAGASGASMMVAAKREATSP